jgi:hypothetical protein
MNGNTLKVCVSRAMMSSALFATDKFFFSEVDPEFNQVNVSAKSKANFSRQTEPLAFNAARPLALTL